MIITQQRECVTDTERRVRSGDLGNKFVDTMTVIFHPASHPYQWLHASAQTIVHQVKLRVYIEIVREERL